MRITTWWIRTEPNEMPELRDSYDETSFDVWGGVPDWYQDTTREHPDGRELIIEVPDLAILALFETPIVEGSATPTPSSSAGNPSRHGKDSSPNRPWSNNA